MYISYLIRCNPSGATRTLSQVKMKHKNILQKANRKKTEARLTGGGPPQPPLTPSEELALSLNKGRPVVAGIPGGSSSNILCSTSDGEKRVKYTDGRIVLLDSPERTQSVTVDEDDDDDEETTSAVTEVDNAGRSTEYIPRDLPTDEGPSASAHNLSRDKLDLLMTAAPRRAFSIKNPAEDYPRVSWSSFLSSQQFLVP
ncbi:uncharacterized protein LOC113092989 isoform X4 [Carassius auratus]|uniref:Uncharacterized protein LOC113092989 isoform X4 n=1 Tax=Carassius auratus TaxID=7957 RepID=A0A6P6P0N5_CARAU|nr:uncharacterized protein LOC113092989 isoform X4 [Carassius auratus]